MNSAYRAFEPYSTSRYMPGFYLGLVSLILAIASMCLKIISLRYKVKSVHSATVDVELENANDGSAQGSGNRRDSGGSG